MDFLDDGVFMHLATPRSAPEACRLAVPHIRTLGKHCKRREVCSHLRCAGSSTSTGTPYRELRRWRCATRRCLLFAGGASREEGWTPVHVRQTLHPALSCG